MFILTIFFPRTLRTNIRNVTQRCVSTTLGLNKESDNKNKVQYLSQDDINDLAKLSHLEFKVGSKEFEDVHKKLNDFVHVIAGVQVRTSFSFYFILLIFKSSPCPKF